jgi:hypothetical protein
MKYSTCEVSWKGKGGEDEPENGTTAGDSVRE